MAHGAAKSRGGRRQKSLGEDLWLWLLYAAASAPGEGHFVRIPQRLLENRWSMLNPKQWSLYADAAYLSIHTNHKSSSWNSWSRSFMRADHIWPLANCWVQLLAPKELRDGESLKPLADSQKQIFLQLQVHESPPRATNFQMLGLFLVLTWYDEMRLQKSYFFC